MQLNELKAKLRSSREEATAQAALIFDSDRKAPPLISNSLLAPTSPAVGDDVLLLRRELQRMKNEKAKLAEDVERREREALRLEEAVRQAEEKTVELEERIRAIGNRSPSSCTTEDPGADAKPESYWKERVDALELDLRRRTARSLELHQRVFGLEAQLRRQLQDNDDRVEDIQASLAEIKHRVITSVSHQRAADEFRASSPVRNGLSAAGSPVRIQIPAPTLQPADAVTTQQC